MPSCSQANIELGASDEVWILASITEGPFTFINAKTLTEGHMFSLYYALNKMQFLQTEEWRQIKFIAKMMTYVTPHL